MIKKIIVVFFALFATASSAETLNTDDGWVKWTPNGWVKIYDNRHFVLLVVDGVNNFTVYEECPGEVHSAVLSWIGKQKTAYGTDCFGRKVFKPVKEFIDQLGRLPSERRIPKVKVLT